MKTIRYIPRKGQEDFFKIHQESCTLIGDKLVGETDPRNFLYFFNVSLNILILPCRNVKTIRYIPRTGQEDYLKINLDTCTLTRDKLVGETDPRNFLYFFNVSLNILISLV